MLTPQQISVLSLVMGRDVSKEMSLFLDARLAFGKALSTEQQMFVSENWPRVDVFLASEKGRVATDLFVSEWQDAMK